MEEFTCDHPYFVKKCTLCMKELNALIQDGLDKKEYVKWGPYKK